MYLTFLLTLPTWLFLCIHLVTFINFFTTPDSFYLGAGDCCHMFTCSHSWFAWSTWLGYLDLSAISWLPVSLLELKVFLKEIFNKHIFKMPWCHSFLVFQTPHRLSVERLLLKQSLLPGMEADWLVKRSNNNMLAGLSSFMLPHFSLT